ncbi:sigma factor-like helix-turn-helix DNA-binding protein [Nitrosomonas supralitoralis]|uniref:RNA polymerase sigma-70 region 4 domain-containing protein n=1 Tax=Nitrosomonas supralitoralis TaxID=2116706 RepID=A0A2P7NR36_9PROT|nr:sigma factor-like helix-turn-helix DNA-binding protein [Nitrosomonas supralitoralis]PSJ15932.1 hypothetical protein C7H79_16280 [Nitrosomonas supralitoralis]
MEIRNQFPDVLDDRLCEALRLRDDLGLTYKEIGEKLGDVSAARASQLVKKARRLIAYGLSNELDGLDRKIAKMLIPIGYTTRDKLAIAVVKGNVYPNRPGWVPKHYTMDMHIEVCKWLGVEPRDYALEFEIMECTEFLQKHGYAVTKISTNT